MYLASSPTLKNFFERFLGGGNPQPRPQPPITLASLVPMVLYDITTSAAQFKARLATLHIRTSENLIYLQLLFSLYFIFYLLLWVSKSL